MDSDDDKKPKAPRNIYEIEAAMQGNPPTNLRRVQAERHRQDVKDARRNRHRHGENTQNPSATMYNTIIRQQGISGGYGGRDGWYQRMSEINFPADEQFRKEAQGMKNRLERDRNMKKKKNEKETKMIKIKDLSTDDFVIPCSFPAVMNVKEENKEDEPIIHPSTIKIDEFLMLPRSFERWADVPMEDDGSEADLPRRDEAIEKLMISNAVTAASALQNSSSAIRLSFEDYPPIHEQCKKMLRTIVIDGCAVMKQVNFKYEVAWNPSGGASNTFKGNKLLVMRPLIELAMRFILQGHKTVIILPNYYKIPVFAGLRQKVDDVPAFNALVSTGIIHFIEEASIEDMLVSLHGENDKREGTWVSTSDLERIIDSYKRAKEKIQPLAGDEAFLADTYKEKKEKKGDYFTHRITPFYYDNKLVLPLHMSTCNKEIVYAKKLLYHDNVLFNMDERRQNQMSMEEQLKILLCLQDVFDLPLRLLRGMMMYRRILKEIVDNEEEKRKIEDEMAVRDFDEETQRAFAMDYNCAQPIASDDSGSQDI